MKVGYFQFAPVFGDITRNLSTMSHRLSTVECDLMVLPELFNTGYQFVSVDEVRALAEEIPGGPTTERLRKLASERGTQLVPRLPPSLRSTPQDPAYEPSEPHHPYERFHLQYELPPPQWLG